VIVSSSPQHFARLGDPVATGAPEPGFAHKHIAFAVVIGASGQLTAVEAMPGYGQARRPRMSVPQPRRRTRGLVANFLCDNTGYALGVKVDRRAQGGFRLDEAAFDCFRDLNETVLDGVADTAVQAFLKFLEHWSPRDFLEVPGFQDKLDLTLGFRFQYDDECLHERHAARLAWKRYLLARGG
jgi:CRISPR-associated protein Csd1